MAVSMPAQCLFHRFFGRCCLCETTGVFQGNIGVLESIARDHTDYLFTGEIPPLFFKFKQPG